MFGSESQKECEQDKRHQRLFASSQQCHQQKIPTEGVPASAKERVARMPGRPYQPLASRSFIYRVIGSFRPPSFGISKSTSNSWLGVSSLAASNQFM